MPYRRTVATVLPLDKVGLVFGLPLDSERSGAKRLPLTCINASLKAPRRNFSRSISTKNVCSLGKGGFSESLAVREDGYLRRIGVLLQRPLAREPVTPAYQKAYHNNAQLNDDLRHSRRSERLCIRLGWATSLRQPTHDGDSNCYVGFAEASSGEADGPPLRQGPFCLYHVLMARTPGRDSCPEATLTSADLPSGLQGSAMARAELFTFSSAV